MAPEETSTISRPSPAWPASASTSASTPRRVEPAGRGGQRRRADLDDDPPGRGHDCSRRAGATLHAAIVAGPAATATLPLVLSRTMAAVPLRHRPRYDPAAYVEAVLALVERIPPGRVMSYGAIAEYLPTEFGRGSARRVGHDHGAVRRYRCPGTGWSPAAGALPPGHEVEARRRLRGRGRAPSAWRQRVAHGWPGDLSAPATGHDAVRRPAGLGLASRAAPTPPRRGSPAAPATPTALTPPK